MGRSDVSPSVAGRTTVTENHAHFLLRAAIARTLTAIAACRLCPSTSTGSTGLLSSRLSCSTTLSKRRSPRTRTSTRSLLASTGLLRACAGRCFNNNYWLAATAWATLGGGSPGKSNSSQASKHKHSRNKKLHRTLLSLSQRFHQATHEQPWPHQFLQEPGWQSQRPCLRQQQQPCQR